MVISSSICFRFDLEYCSRYLGVKNKWLAGACADAFSYFHEGVQRAKKKRLRTTDLKYLPQVFFNSHEIVREI